MESEVFFSSSFPVSILVKYRKTWGPHSLDWSCGYQGVFELFCMIVCIMQWPMAWLIKLISNCSSFASLSAIQTRLAIPPSHNTHMSECTAKETYTQKSSWCYLSSELQESCNYFFLFSYSSFSLYTAPEGINSAPLPSFCLSFSAVFLNHLNVLLQKMKKKILPIFSFSSTFHFQAFNLTVSPSFIQVGEKERFHSSLCSPLKNQVHYYCFHSN